MLRRIAVIDSFRLHFFLIETTSVRRQLLAHGYILRNYVSPKLFLYLREGLAPGLDHAEHYEEGAQHAYHGEEEEDCGGTERLDGARKGHRDDEGQQPIETSGAGRRRALQARREDLAHVGPGDRTCRRFVTWLRERERERERGSHRSI